MHSHYEDRGIMKWAPFDALVGFHGLLNELKEKLGQRERPVLSDDDFDTLNKNLMHALEFKSLSSIYYYKGGYIRQLYGRITKADFIFKKITIDHHQIIAAKDLIAIECL